MKGSWARWAVLVVAALLAGACGTSARSSAASAGPTATDATVSTSPPDTQPASDCERAARTLDAPPSTVATDALQLVLAGREAPLPLPGHDHPAASVQRYATAEAYVANNPGIPDPDTRVQVMQRDGFRDGVDVDLRVGRDEYFVGVLAFASPSAAADFARYHAFPICQGATDIQPVPGLAHAIVYNRLVDGQPPIAKVVFVAGADEVSLAICPCVAGGDERLKLASAWAVDVAHQLGIG